MKFRVFIFLTVALTVWHAETFAKIAVCEHLVENSIERKARKLLLPGRERSFDEYSQEFAPEDFSDRINHSKLWIDFGGQLGIATSQARALLPSLRTVNATLSLEKYPRAGFHDADVITDIDHTLSRTSHPDFVLNRVNGWLGSEGVAYLTVDEGSRVRVGSKSLSMMDWILDRSGMICSALNRHAIKCFKRSNREVRPLKLISLRDGHREFSEGHDDDLEPNVEFRVINSEGKEVGLFDGRLSFDGEVMSNMFFFMKEKGQGHSKEVARELMNRYPKLNELRGVLIEDNLRKFESELRKTHSAEKAIVETAFYRTFAPYGFQDVELPENSSGVYVILRKGPPRVVSHGQFEQN